MVGLGVPPIMLGALQAPVLDVGSVPVEPVHPRVGEGDPDTGVVAPPLAP